MSIRRAILAVTLLASFAGCTEADVLDPSAATADDQVTEEPDFVSIIKQASLRRIDPQLAFALTDALSTLEEEHSVFIQLTHDRFDKAKLEDILGVKLNSVAGSIATADLSLADILRLTTHPNVGFIEDSGPVAPN